MMDWADIRRKNTAGALAPVTVNVPSKISLLSEVAQLLRSKTGFCIATLNLDHVVKFGRLPAFRDAYRRHSHVTADGNPIVWLSRLAGHKISLVPGSELIDPIAELAVQNSAKVALFGSTTASLESAARILVVRHPGLQIVAKLAPPMGFQPESYEADRFILEIGQSEAQLCFLALGAPKQEIFAIRAHEQLPHVGFLSIGAGLDFISGIQVRAPKIVRAIGAEWLWRLAADPRRLAARYGACVMIMPGLTRAALNSRANHGQGD